LFEVHDLEERENPSIMCVCVFATVTNVVSQLSAFILARA